MSGKGAQGIERSLLRLEQGQRCGSGPRQRGAAAPHACSAPPTPLVGRLQVVYPALDSKVKNVTLAYSVEHEDEVGAAASANASAAAAACPPPPPAPLPRRESSVLLGRHCPVGQPFCFTLA